MNEAETYAIGALMEPDPIKFGFGAPGWYILLGLLLLLLLIYGVISYIKYQRNRYRREAIEILLNLELSTDRTSYFITRVAAVLKRVAISSYCRMEVGALTGKEWLVYLDRKNSGMQVLAENPRILLTEQLYQSSAKQATVKDLEELRSTSVQWIKKHRV